MKPANKKEIYLGMALIGTTGVLIGLVMDSPLLMAIAGFLGTVIGGFVGWCARGNGQGDGECELDRHGVGSFPQRWNVGGYRASRLASWCRTAWLARYPRSCRTKFSLALLMGRLRRSRIRLNVPA